MKRCRGRRKPKYLIWPLSRLTIPMKRAEFARRSAQHADYLELDDSAVVVKDKEGIGGTPYSASCHAGHHFCMKHRSFASAQGADRKSYQHRPGRLDVGWEGRWN
jgi:hypothetical protein